MIFEQNIKEWITVHRSRGRAFQTEWTGSIKASRLEWASETVRSNSVWSGMSEGSNGRRWGIEGTQGLDYVGTVSLLSVTFTLYGKKFFNGLIYTDR